MSEAAVALSENRCYSPLTKSVDIEQTCMLLGLAHELGSVASFKQEGLHRLPQTSRVRRQEVIWLTLRKFLDTEGDRIVVTPFLRILADPHVDSTLKRDLLYLRYLQSTPLVWEAVAELLLPRLETSGRCEVQTKDWNTFLKSRLRTFTSSTLSRTRSHLTAHLTKFGVLEEEQIEGAAIGKRFYARYAEPDVRAFLFGLAIESRQNGWSSRSVEWLATDSWTRIGFCTRPTYARFAVDQGNQWGLTVYEYFGNHRQIVWRCDDPSEHVAQLILAH